MRVVVNNLGKVAQAGRAVDLAAVKNHLDVYHGDDDTRINDNIAAATEYFETVTQCPIVKTNYEMLMAGWPKGGFPRQHSDIAFEIPRWPLDSLTSVEAWEKDAGDWSDASAVFETVAHNDLPSELVKLPGQSLPRLDNRALPVRIRWVAGWAPEDVPHKVRHAIKVLVRHWYDHPEAVIVGTIGQEMPRALKSLLAACKPGHVPGSKPGVIV